MKPSTTSPASRHLVRRVSTARQLAVATALALSGPAFAGVCTSNNSLALAATAPFGNGFSAAATYADCWEFSLSTLSDVSGTTTEIPSDYWFLPRFIDLQRVELWDVATHTQVGATDLTPDVFGFNGVAAGTYHLMVEGYTSLGFGTASYAGTLTATPQGTVSEPSASALLALALGAATLAGRRRQAACG